MKCFSMPSNSAFRRSLLLVTAALFIGLSGFAQILTFDFAGAAGNEATWPSNSNDARLTSSVISRSPALYPALTAGIFNSTGWAGPHNASPDPNRYLEFTITPLPGKKFSITLLTFTYRRVVGITAPLKMVIRTSADGFTSNVGGIVNFPNNVNDFLPHTTTRNFSILDQQTPLTIRFYPYNAQPTWGGQFGLGSNIGNDIIVNGTTQDLSTTVQFVNTASTVTEGGGPVDLPLSIINPSSTTPTSVTISKTDILITANFLYLNNCISICVDTYTAV